MKFKITGKVVHGDGYGRKLGFPTANLEVINQKLPKAGVYAGNAILENKVYRAGIVVGPLDKVEAHLIGYSSNAYDKEVTLQFNEFLREYKEFKTEEELIIQIKKDLEKC